MSGARRAGEKRPVLYDYEVSHPEYGTVTVSSIGPDSATLAAAEEWGATWRLIAGYCSVRRGSPSRRPRCRTCGKEFGEPGTAGIICPDCTEMQEKFRRDIRKVQSLSRKERMERYGAWKG